MATNSGFQTTSLFNPLKISTNLKTFSVTEMSRKSMLIL